MGDDVVVQTAFAEMQPFKGMENYFTDSLLYQENNKPVKQSFPGYVDSGNEANSESEEDTWATFSIEPIVAYLVILIVIILPK